MAELDDVKRTECIITLGGKEREIRFHYRAWAALEEEYHGIENIKEAIEKAKFATMANLIYIGIKREDGETITRDAVDGWLDEYDLAGLIELVTTVTKALFSSLPAAKKGAKSDPQEAK